MRLLRPVISVLVFICLCAASRAPAADQARYDVVVYGGTSGGIAAALQVSRMGKTVVLIEPSGHLGGLTSGGLGFTDTGDKRVIGGIAREFYQRIKQHYDQPAAWKFEKADEYDRYRPDDDAMWTFEPHIAERVFAQMLAERQIPIALNQRLDRDSGVTRDGQRIVSIRMESGLVFRGNAFIDATYEGDLMAAAGVSYTVGRESNAQYGETLNGVQKLQNIHNHLFIKQVDPYVTPGDPTSGLLPGVHGDPPGEEGAADHRVQAYCFRMCMSNVAENRVPFPKPASYDEQRYELLLRNFEAGDLRFPMKPDMMPNGKTDTNNNCAFSTDNIGMNYDYPEASYERRDEIIREHRDYQEGFMWTLANHPRVPESIRQQMAVWGLAKDEFVDNGNWPHQLYIREARRMVGDYVMTELDCRRQKVAEDSVGLGSYNMDSHNVQRYVTPDGFAQNEGDVQVSPGGAYLISYRALVPKRGEARNLLVPVCLSSSHIAYGSIRMEPVFMILGQSAATAAVQALETGVDVQDVDYARLRERLLADRQVLDLPAPTGSGRGIPSSQIEGTVVDDEKAMLIGVWTSSTSVGPFIERSYRHDQDGDKGQLSARFETELPAGLYSVRIAYTPHANRATNVPVTIHHRGGIEQKRINQRQAPADGPFAEVGVFEFGADQPALVIIKNDGTDGHVIIDAVAFVPAER